MTIGVDVEPDAPPSVTNIARVAGGGDVDGSSNTAEDRADQPGPGSAVSKSHSTDFIPGQRGVHFSP